MLTKITLIASFAALALGFAVNFDRLPSANDISSATLQTQQQLDSTAVAHN